MENNMDLETCRCGVLEIDGAMRGQNMFAHTRVASGAFTPYNLTLPHLGDSDGLERDWLSPRAAVGTNTHCESQRTLKLSKMSSLSTFADVLWPPEPHV